MIDKERFFIFKNWWWFVAAVGIIGLIITAIELLWLNK